MNDQLKVQSLLNAVTRQRDDAMNQAAVLAAELTVVRAELEVLNERLSAKNAVASGVADPVAPNEPAQGEDDADPHLDH